MSISHDNIISTSDLIEVFVSLTSEAETLAEVIEEAREALTDADPVELTTEEFQIKREALDEAERELAEWVDENGELFSELEGFNHCPPCADWLYGEPLISEDYFEDYARELAEETGDVDRDLPWPLNCIDWEKAADELRQDYTEIEVDGRIYYALS